MSDPNNLVEMEEIYKSFPGVVANDHIDFSVREGEIHGLLGENGAGKSTLMKILFGLYSADEGTIRCRGTETSINSPRDATDAGFGMVHQHFKLIPKLTVTENVVLGLRESYPMLDDESGDEDGGLLDGLLNNSMVSKLGRMLTYDQTAASDRVKAVADQYGIDIDPDKKVHELGVGERQRVEILKALYRDIDLLVLDEPTAVLTPDQIDRLFDTLRGLVERGLTVIIITHKLEEVTTITDRVTVLRDGAKVDTVETETIDEADLAQMMVGRNVVYDIERTSTEIGDPVLYASEITCTDDRGVELLSDTKLSIREGEILGLAGVSGNGQKALADSIAGMREIDGGQIYLNGQDITASSIQERVDAGMSYVPADRQQEGCAPQLSLSHNGVVKDYRDEKFSSGLWELGIDYQQIRNHTEEIVSEYDVKASHVNEEAGTLSGGNLQKLILGREISRQPDFLIADQPTRGLDVGAIESIRENLLEQRKQGTGILLISEKLDEIIELSDRIAVMYEGEIVHTMSPDETNKKELGLYMNGGAKASTAKSSAD